MPADGGEHVNRQNKTKQKTLQNAICYSGFNDAASATLGSTSSTITGLHGQQNLLFSPFLETKWAVYHSPFRHSHRTCLPSQKSDTMDPQNN